MDNQETVHYNAELDVIVVVTAIHSIYSSYGGAYGYLVTYIPKKLYGKRGWISLGLL